MGKRPDFSFGEDIGPVIFDRPRADGAESIPFGTLHLEIAFLAPAAGNKMLKNWSVPQSEATRWRIEHAAPDATRIRRVQKDEELLTQFRIERMGAQRGFERGRLGGTT